MQVRGAPRINLPPWRVTDDLPMPIHGRAVEHYGLLSMPEKLLVKLAYNASSFGGSVISLAITGSTAND